MLTKPFDQLAKNWEQWFEIRQIRNEISHDYPVISEEGINSLNRIIESLAVLKNAHARCMTYLGSRNNSIPFNR